MTKETENNVREIEFQFVALIEDEQLDANDLPQEVKGKINGCKMQYSRYKKAPTPALYKSVIQMDVTICDMIQNWLEEDITDEEAAALAKQKAAEAAADDGGQAAEKADDGGQAAEKADDGGQAAEKADDGGQSAAKADDGGQAAVKADDGGQAAATPKEGVDARVAQVKAKLDKRGRISVDDLKAILGKSPSYPKEKSIKGIVLKKVFARPEYQLES